MKWIFTILVSAALLSQSCSKDGVEESNRNLSLRFHFVDFSGGYSHTPSVVYIYDRSGGFIHQEMIPEDSFKENIHVIYSFSKTADQIVMFYGAPVDYLPANQNQNLGDLLRDMKDFSTTEPPSLCGYAKIPRIDNDIDYRLVIYLRAMDDYEDLDDCINGR